MTSLDARSGTLAPGPAVDYGSAYEELRQPCLRIALAKHRISHHDAENAYQTAWLELWRVIRRGEEVRDLRGCCYRAFQGDPACATTAKLNLKITASSTMVATPKALHNGQAVWFKGQLRGPAPGSGVQILLQAKVGAIWKTFRAVRTDGKGRWKHKYRFQRTFRPTTFAFRARILRDTVYPFEPGSSSVIHVAVR